MTAQAARGVRLALLLAAERLMAERGLDAVSMSEITAASGARNASAINYHFQDRRGLVEAIIAHRLSAVDRRRAEMLAALKAAGREEDLRALVEAKVRPLGETVRPGSGAEAWVPFLVQLHASPNWGLDELADARDGPALREVHERIAALLPLPPRLARRRVRLSLAFSVIALREMQRRQGRPAADAEAELADIVAMQAAALRAPA